MSNQRRNMKLEKEGFSPEWKEYAERKIKALKQAKDEMISRANSFAGQIRELEVLLSGEYVQELNMMRNPGAPPPTNIPPLQKKEVKPSLVKEEGKPEEDVGKGQKAQETGSLAEE